MLAITHRKCGLTRQTIQSYQDAFLKSLSTGAVNPSGKEKQLIVLHIGSEDGFLPGG